MSADVLGGRVRTLQIIVVAIALGAAMLLVVGLFIKSEPQENPGLLTTLGILSVNAVAMRLIVPRLIMTAVRKRAVANSPPLEGEGLDTALLAGLQTSRIVAVALIESVAMLAGVLYLNTRDPMGLAVGVGAVAVILAHFPTRSGVKHWLENQRSLVESDRQFAPLNRTP